MTTDAASPAATATTRVLIADDQASTRRFLRAILGELANLEVVGEAADGGEAVALVEALRPDVVLLDLSMPVLEGADAIAAIRRAAPSTSVVILSGMEPEVGEALVGPGVLGSLGKDLSPTELLQALGDMLDTERGSPS